MSLWHEQSGVDGDVILFQCTDCGQIELSLGALHAHIERHRGYTRWNIQVPFTRGVVANWEELMARTEVLRVQEVEQITLDDVPSEVSE